MADAIGSVYFDALLRTTKLSDQIEAEKKKRQNIYFDALFNAQGLQSQVNKATAGIGRTVDISTNISVKGLDKLKSSYGTFATFAGTSLANALGDALDKASQTVNQIVGIGLGFGKDSLNSFREVRSELNLIQQKARASDDEIKKLESSIVRVASSTTGTPQSLVALSDTLVQSGRTLKETENLLRPITIGSAGLKRASADLAGDVVLLADSLKLDLSDVRTGTQILEALSSATLSANVNADQLAESIRFFRSQQSGASGLSNTFSVLSLGAAGGLQGSRAGTNFNRLFVQSIKNSEKVLETFGVSVKDSQGNLRGELDILRDLSQAYNNLAKSQGSAIAVQEANRLFQTQGSRALQAVAGITETQFKKIVANVERGVSEGGILEALGESQLKGLGGAFLELENRIASFQVALGSKLSPAVEAVVRSITKIFAEIAENEPLLNSIGAAAQRFADALSAPQVQEALVRVGQILTGLIQSGVDYIAKQTLAIGEAIQKNPEILESIAETISSIVSATFELLAGLIEIGLQIASAVAPLVSVSGIVSSLKIVLSEVINLATTFFTAFNAGAGESVLTVTNLQSAIKLAGQLLQPVAALFGGISGTLARIAVSVIDLVENSGLISFTSTLTRNLTVLFGNIQSSLPGIVRTIASAISSFGSGLSSGIGRVNIDAPNLQLPQLNIAEAARGFGETIGEIGARIFNLTSRISEIVVNRIVPALLRIGEALAPVVNSLLVTVFDLVSKLVPLIEKAINLTIGFITDNLPGLQQFLLQAVDVFAKISGFVVGIIAQLVNGVSQSTTLQNLWSAITSFVGQLLTNIKTLFETIATNLNSLEGVRSLISSIAGFVGTVVSGVIRISTNLARASASVSGISSGFTLIVGFVDEQAGKFGEFFDSITKVVDKLEFLPRLGESAQTIFRNLTDGLNVFISAFLDKARPALDPVFKAVEEATPMLLNLILKLGQWASQFSVAFQPVAEFVGTVLGNAVALAGKLLAHLINTVGKVAEFISTNERIQEIINFVSNAVGVIFKTLTSVSNTITSIQGNVIDGVYPVLEFVTLGVVKILDTISNIGYKVLVFVIEKLTQIGSWVSGLIENLLPTTQKLVVSFWDMLNEKWTAFWTAVSQWFTKTLPEAIASTYTRITDTVNLVNESINKFFASIITWLSETFTNTVRSAYEFVADTIKTIGEYISQWFTYVLTWITETFWKTITSAYDFINSIVKSIGDYVSQWFNYVIGWITDTFFKTVQSTNEYVSSVIQYIGETVSGWFSYVIEWLNKSLSETVKGAYEYVTGWINLIGKAVSDWFAWAINWLIKTLPDTIKGLYDKVIAWVQAIGSKINEWFQFLWKWFIEEFPKIIEGTVKFISDKFFGVFDFIWKKIGEIKDWLTGGFQGTLTSATKGLTDKFGGAIDGILNKWKSFSSAVSSVGSALTGSSSGTTSGGSPKGANTEAIKAALGGRPVKLGSNEQIFNQAGLGTPLVTTVKAFENFYERAYADGRQISIGFGTKARSRNETITVEDANIRLRDELLKARKEVEDIVVRGYGRQLNQGQLDALTSFAYNLGGGALRTLFDNGRRSNAVVAEKIKLYNKADLLDGKGMRVLEGLRIRRNFESDMFKGIYGGVADAAARSQQQAAEVNNLFKSANVTAPIKLPTLRSNTLPGLQHFGAPRAGGTRKHAGFDTDHANDANSVVQAILGGEIIRVAAQRDSRGRLTGYGNYIDIYNKALGVVERIAEFDKRVFSEADVGKTIRAGAIVGRGTTFRGVDHREIRDIEKYRTAPFGYNSARDPAAYLVGLRLYERTPQGSLVPTGRSISQQVRSGYGGAVDTIAQATEISSRVLQNIGENISTQAIADFTESLALTLSNIESQKLTSRVQPDAMTEASNIVKELTEQTGIQLSQSALNQLTDTLAVAIANATGLEYNANRQAQALLPTATAGTTPGTSVYGLILEGINKAADLLQSIDLSVKSLLSFTNQLVDYIYSIRQRVLGKINVGLASADSENFQLLTQGRQSLQEQRFLSDRLPRLFSLQQEQATAAVTPGGINQQDDGQQRYSFTDNIRRIADYAQLVYELIGQKLGLLATSKDGDVPRFSTSEYNTGLLEVLNSISNKLTEWYESIMSYFNTSLTTNTNASAEAQADAGLTGSLNNLVNVLDNFYRILEDKQAKMRDYYQAEGLDTDSVPVLAALEALLGATSLALKDSDYSNLLANTPEGFAITLHTKPLAGITAPTTRDLNLNITTHLATIAGNQVEVATMPEVRRLLQEAKAQITNERHDEMYDPRYTSEISLASLESLRRDSGLRSVILG